VAVFVFKTGHRRLILMTVFCFRASTIYNALPQWGYRHQSVCHSAGEYARDEDGDGFHEVHVNTMEGFWSLLRSWLRPHRGISQDKLPLYLGFFEFVHNIRRRGRALLGALVYTLVQPEPCP
ncbi:MAG: transposase, partial [Gammaproteobacteria bacterium]